MIGFWASWAWLLQTYFKKTALHTGRELFIRVIWIGATFVFRFREFNIYWVLRPFMVAILFFFLLLLANLAEFFVFFLLL